jgi:tellurite methyltransferase
MEWYWEMLDPSKWPDPIVARILSELPPNSEIYEFGAGRGRNSLFLAQKGYEVVAQDISQRVLESLTSEAASLGVSVETECSAIPELILDKKYGGVVYTRVLHFLERDEAVRAVTTLQNNTEDGGYHALVIFTAGTDPQKSPGTTAPYYPTEGEFMDLYAGWKVVHRVLQPIKKAPQGQIFEGLELLLKKPCDA